MSFCTQQILTLASGIHDEINAPSAISVGYLSGILTSSGALGELNNRLSTNFYLSGDAPCIAGGFGAEESAIYALMYEHVYYKKQELASLQGIGVGALSLREGDSAVTFTNRVDISKAFGRMKKEAQEDLNIATAQWKRNHVLATSVDASSLSSWPTP